MNKRSENKTTSLRDDQNEMKFRKDELNERDLDQVSGGLQVYGGTLHPVVLSSNGAVFPS